MRIVEIREMSCRLEGDIANALVSFAEHTVSLIAVVTDVQKDGKPLIGVAFNSIGRFAQPGILRERMIPRLMAAKPESLLVESGTRFDPAKISAVALRNEKPGGHGDRATAMGGLELAFWDINAKLADKPAYKHIAETFGRKGDPHVSVYAAGGYYYPHDGLGRLKDEFAAYKDQGFTAFKMKIGGASLSEDMARIEGALKIAGDGQNLAVDANGRYDLETARETGRAIQPLNLRWYEEAGDPLDFKLNAELAETYSGALATGENLFSLPDVKNLINFGGMRPGKDIFQMDAGLSYGLTEYEKMIALMEANGFDRKYAFPHGGHLIGLSIVCGLGLGGCEAYPGVFQPFGGYSPASKLNNGTIRLSDAPGFGLEEKTELQPLLAKIKG